MIMCPTQDDRLTSFRLVCAESRREEAILGPMNTSISLMQIQRLREYFPGTAQKRNRRDPKNDHGRQKMFLSRAYEFLIAMRRTLTWWRRIFIACHSLKVSGGEAPH